MVHFALLNAPYDFTLDCAFRGMVKSQEGCPSFGWASVVCPIVPPAIFIMRAFAGGAGDPNHWMASVFWNFIIMGTVLSYVAWMVLVLPVLSLIRDTALCRPIPLVLAGAASGVLAYAIADVSIDRFNPAASEYIWIAVTGAIEGVVLVLATGIQNIKASRQDVL